MYTFFLGNKMSTNESLSTKTTKEPQISAIYSIIACVTAVGLFQRYVQGFFTDLCIFSCALTMWLHSKIFSDNISLNDQNAIENGLVYA